MFEIKQQNIRIFNMLINLWLLTLILILTINITYAKPFTIKDLTTAALDTNCLDFCVDGVCLWLKCGFFGCSVKTTPHIKHNLPDLVVSTYNNPGDSPFTQTKLLDVVPAIAGGNLDSHQKKTTMIRFKEASIIGNPVAYAIGNQRFLCRSNIKPYRPYYLSTLDAIFWRSGVTEMIYPASYIPGLKEVGSAFNSWGSIYPRAGFINQPNDVKAAAVIAERALSIVSKPGQPHIYQQASNAKSGKWQMISPEQQSCQVFGQGEPNIAADKHGQYAFIAWQQYSCCIPGSGQHITNIISGCVF